MSRITESLYRISGLELTEAPVKEIDSDTKFNEFLSYINGKDTGEPPYRENGWWYYEFEDSKGNINTFFCHAYNYEAYDASYNHKYLADRLKTSHYFNNVKALAISYNKRIK